MKIKRLEISNWRSIKSLSIDVNNLAIFIGQNNNGKSNILNSILFFFGEIKHSDQDFNDCDNELYVEITFCFLDEHDKAQFEKYVSPTSNEIKVRKIAKKGSVAEYRGYTEIPVDEKLREENMSLYLTIDKRKELAFSNKLPTGGKISIEVIKSELRQYLKENKDAINVNYQIEETQFMGAKNVAQSLFGEVLFIPAVTVASSELSAKGSSMFNRLYSRIASKLTEANPLYREASAALTRLVDSMNKIKLDGSENTERPEELTHLENLIASELTAWKSTIEIEFQVPNVDDSVKLDTSVLIHDGVKTDIDRKGNGLQRSLVFALIKSWAVIVREDKIRSRNEENENVFKRGVSNSTYFIFEEPELFLHPQAQRELFASLKGLSESDNQVLLTTHSSSFIDLNDHKSIIIVHKDDFSVGTTTVQCNEELYIQEEDKKLFNLQLWFTPERNEAFFAKKIIIVEGETEKVVMPFLAKKIGIHRYDYTLITAGSKNSMPLYIHLFNCFKLKYTVVYDKDEHARKSLSDLNEAKNVSKKIEKKISNALGNSVIFENDFEEEINLIVTSDRFKPFSALQHVTNDDYEISESLERKLRLIYS